MEYNEYILNVIISLKINYDEYGMKPIEDLDDVIDENYEYQFFEKLYSSDLLIAEDYNEGTGNTKFFFASEAMTEYYRLARKIGKVMGWNDKNNVYIKEAKDYDHDCMRYILNDYTCCSLFYTGTKHKYASSWIVYTCDEFYNYEELYFAMYGIFSNYEVKVKKLRKIYNRLVSSCLYLLIPQEMEMAA